MTLTKTQLMMAVTGSASPSGSYDPVSNERQIRVAGQPSSDLSKMVSLHESYHAFLNSSTTFGIAMIFCGALAESGKPGFLDLVKSMVDHSTETHECYATSIGLIGASHGDVTSDLLDGFPAYKRHIDIFDRCFEAGRRPALASILLSCAARAAMQTPIYKPLRARRCAMWPQIRIGPRDLPDNRFRTLLDPVVLANAIRVAETELTKRGDLFAKLANPKTAIVDQWNAFISLSPDDIRDVDIAIFASFANSLTRSGEEVPGYDDQKIGLSDLQSRVDAELGADSGRKFVAPDNSEQDVSAVLSDFSREVLILRSDPLPAVFTDLEEQSPDVIDAFIHSGSAGRHLQFSAMPRAKAAILFSVSEELPALTRLTGSHISGYRRLAHNPAGGYRVETLLIRPGELDDGLAAHADVDTFSIISLTTFNDPEWRAEWMLPALNIPGPIAVLMDDSPVALLAEMIEQREAVEVCGFRTRFPVVDADPIDMDCITMTKANSPEVLFFSPCTSALRMAFLYVATTSGPLVDISTSPPTDWSPRIARFLFNLVQEEGRFGCSFWDWRVQI